MGKWGSVTTVVAAFVSRHRGGTAVVTSVVAVLATATWAMVVQDTFPVGKATEFDLLGTTRPRITAAVTMATLLGGLVWALARSRQVSGTLYYLRVLDDQADDFHDQAVLLARREALDYRAVVKTLSLGRERWVDIAAECNEVRLSLQIAGNEDDDNSSYDFAPNAYWPVSFAIGYDWPLNANTTLIEFHQARRSFAVRMEHATMAHVPEQSALRDHAARLVAVDAFLTSGIEAASAAKIRATVRSVFGTEPDAVLAIGAANDDTDGLVDVAEADRRPRATISAVNAPGVISALDAALRVARGILIAADRYPNAHIAVTLRVPKTVAVLAGRYLSVLVKSRELPTDQQQNWFELWHRMVLIHHNLRLHEPQALRVRSAQPSSAPPPPG